MLRVRALGPLALELDGVSLGVPGGATARSVLAWLLLHPGIYPRVHVAARFWPDVVDQRARASLRTAIWDIRRAVDRDARPPWLHTSRDKVGVPPDVPRSVDVDDFETLVASGEKVRLEQALELAERPLLSDLADDWVLERRDAVHDRAAEAALELAQDAEAAGDVRTAVSCSRHAVRHAPLDEHAHRLLMQRLVIAGEPAQALTVFERLQATLAAEIGVEVTAETRSLADRLRGRRPATDHVQVLEEEAVCRASALEVWKLLQDPLRYPEWWEGLVEVKRTADGLTRWMGALPGVPIPTRVDLRRAAGGVVIRCEVTGIIHVWTLQPAPEGCRVRLRAAVPAEEAEGWLEQQRGEVRASLPRLVRAAERSAQLAA